MINAVPDDEANAGGQYEFRLDAGATTGCGSPELVRAAEQIISTSVQVEMCSTPSRDARLSTRSSSYLDVVPASPAM